MDLGGTIRRFRTINKMEQKDLAKLLNISDKTVSSWETNRTQPKMEMIEKMCEIFHCQKSDFLDDPSVLPIIGVDRVRVGDSLDYIAVTDNEKNILAYYRMLSEPEKDHMSQMMRVMAYAKYYDSFKNDIKED